MLLELGESIVGAIEFVRVGDFEFGGGEGGHTGGGAAFAHGFSTLKNPCEGVVVADGDGVEFVVVAAGAAEGHAKEGAPDGVDLFVDEFHFEELVVLEFVVEGAEDEVAGADELGVSLVGRVVGKEIAGEVFADELIVGFVSIEGVDDVVAEAPGIREDEGASAAAGLGEAGDIEPMAAPAFAEFGAGEEVIDDGFEGGGRGIGEEDFHFLGRGREAEEVIVDSAEEGMLWRGGCGREVCGFEAGEDEVIGRGGGPGGIFDFWNGRGDEWLEGPELAAFFEVDFGSGGFEVSVTGVGGSHADPGFEFCDRGIGKTVFGRHFEVAIGVGDSLEEEGIFGITGDDGGAGIAAGLPTDAGVEGEVGLALFGVGGMALVTMLREKGADVGFEVFKSFLAVCMRHQRNHQHH